MNAHGIRGKIPGCSAPTVRKKKEMNADAQDLWNNSYLSSRAISPTFELSLITEYACLDPYS